jgi:hypothetical protein
MTRVTKISRVTKIFGDPPRLIRLSRGIAEDGRVLWRLDTKAADDTETTTILSNEAMNAIASAQTELAFVGPGAADEWVVVPKEQEV